ncbi:MAG TPA: hypothetical protein VFO77_06450 [Actinoplanes sp.]|nr:hypothetical protein [Actinoplanes sp.]
MSQNGPYPGQPWSAGGVEPPGSGASTGSASIGDGGFAGGAGEPEPQYQAPADPWSDQTGGWGADPYQTALAPTGTQPPPVWLPQEPPTPSATRPNTLIVVMVVVLSLLVVGGLGTTVYLLKNADARTPAAASTTAPATAGPTPEPQNSKDARFVVVGQCIRNEGTPDKPRMAIATCGDGTYEVLARVEGRTTGEADAQAKCAKVRQYTKWYFYDSQLDSLDFVLCLRDR